jgi:glycosyltransferase involved in cell wall biosynthesis
LLCIDKVSILIPVYNRKSWIKQTLDSAISQTYANIEIIVVDNRSTDGGYELVKEYATQDNRIKVYQNDSNIGPVKNWLKCLEYSTGEYIKILFSDDLISSNFIEKTIEYLRNDDSIAFSYTGAQKIDANQITDEIWYQMSNIDSVYSTKDFYHIALLGSSWSEKKVSVPVSPGCALFRRKDVEKNLIVDIPNKQKVDFNTFGAGNDLLLYLLTAKEYKKVAFVASAMSYFRAHDGSITCSNNISKYYFLAKMFFLKILNDTELMSEFTLNLYETNVRDGNDNITKVKERYFKWVELYVNNSTGITHHLRHLKTSPKNVVIFGTKELGRLLGLEVKKSKLNLLAFIDNNQAVQGQRIDNVSIVPSMWLMENKREYDVIIVSIEGDHDIKIIEMLKREVGEDKLILSWKDLFIRDHIDSQSV